MARQHRKSLLVRLCANTEWDDLYDNPVRGKELVVTIFRWEN